MMMLMLRMMMMISSADGELDYIDCDGISVLIVAEGLIIVDQVAEQKRWSKMTAPRSKTARNVKRERQPGLNCKEGVNEKEFWRHAIAITRAKCSFVLCFCARWSVVPRISARHFRFTTVQSPLRPWVHHHPRPLTTYLYGLVFLLRRGGRQMPLAAAPCAVLAWLLFISWILLDKIDRFLSFFPILLLCCCSLSELPHLENFDHHERDDEKNTDNNK